MANFNLDTVVELPEKQKIKIINKIWESIDETPPHSYTEKEIDTLLRKRLKEIKSKKVKTDSWENVKKRVLKKAEARIKNA